MAKLSRENLRYSITTHFTHEELRDLAFQLGLSIGDVGQPTALVMELINQVEEHDRMDELIDILSTYRPNVPWLLYQQSNIERIDISKDSNFFGKGVKESETEDKLNTLNRELVNLRQQLSSLKEATKSNENIDDRLRELIRTTSLAYGSSQSLMAEMIPPSPDASKIRLIPEHHFNRLKEYHADENIIYLLIGTFTGATLGIVVNWVTNVPFVLSPVSITFLVLFILLTVATIFWATRLNKRIKSVLNQIFTQ